MDLDRMKIGHEFKCIVDFETRTLDSEHISVFKGDICIYDGSDDYHYTLDRNGMVFNIYKELILEYFDVDEYRNNRIRRLALEHIG